MTARTVAGPSTAQAQREVWLLAGMAFMLPLFEAPKNLLWLAYLMLWCWHAWQRGHAGGPWRGWYSWDGMVLGSLLLALVGTGFAGLKGQEWVGVRDLFRYLPLLWVLTRSEYSRAQWRQVFASLIAGTLLAVAWGAWVWWRSGSPEMGLHSVGHSNHSAAFICIVLAVALGVALESPGPDERHARIRQGAAWMASGVLLLGILATGSRIGLAVAALLAVSLPLAHALQPGGRRRPLVGVLLAGAACAAMLAVTQPWVLRKHQRNLSEHNVLAYRDALWSQAMTAFRAHPLWGVGMDNFSRIDLPTLNAWERDQGRPQSPPGIYQSVHAHSLYLDALSERGLAGGVSLFALIWLWAGALRRQWPRGMEGRAPPAFMQWGAASGALGATLAIGLVNTTLHTELALAAMVCLGSLPGAPPVAEGD